MARKQFDNVRHMIPTPGTGEITFGSVPTTFRSFAAAGAIAGDQPGYTIQDGDAIEIGYLTLGSGALTATRAVVYSSNSNNPLDLSGSAILECTPLASMINDDVVSFVREQSPTSGEKTRARSNLGMTTTGQALATAMNAADARDTIGATATGSALLTAADAVAARAAIAATSNALSADASIVSGHRDGLVLLIGSHTLALGAVATLKDGFRVSIRNVGTGIWTIDPNGSEPINGKLGEIICPGESCLLVCDGGGWWTVGLSSEPTISSMSANNSATIDFTNIYPGHFKSWRVELRSIIPVGNNAILGLRVGSSGVWQQGATDYDHQVWRFTSSATGVGGDVATATYMGINTGDGLANSGITGLCGSIECHVMDGGGIPRFTWQAAWLGQGASLSGSGSGAYRAFVAFDGLRFFCNNGSISSGEFILTGRRK